MSNLGLLSPPSNGALLEPPPDVDAGPARAPRVSTARDSRAALAEVPPVPAQPVAVAAAGADRIPTLDAVRLVASAGVVWAHAMPVGDPAANYGVFGTPFFTFAAVFFALRGVQKHPGRTFGSYARARFVRLYVPFLAWSLIYLIARNVQARVFPGAAPVPLRLIQLLRGTNMHLWFLPFVLLACLAVFPLARWLARRPRVAPRVAGVCAAAALAFPLVPKPDFSTWGRGIDTLLNAGYFFDRSWEVVPSLLLAVTLYVAFARSRPNLKCPLWIGVGGLAMAVVALGSFHFVGYHMLGRTLAGLGLMLFALCPMPPAAGPAVRRIAALGPYGVGIYLAHPLVTVFLRKAWDLGNHRPLTFAGGVVIFVAAFTLSGVVAAVLYRSRYTRWLVA